MMHKLEQHEYPTYYSRYIKLVMEDDLLSVLDGQKNEMTQLLNSIGEEAAGFRYAPEKWSIKEVIGHVMDVEYVFSYRALRFARKDQTPLPEFDQDEYIKSANFDSRTLISLSDEYRAVRECTSTLFGGFEESMFNRQGIASGQTFSVRAVAYIIAGHELHHISVLKEKYLKI
jgi:hypothetical protein